MDEEQYRELRITNDFMFTRVMKNPEICLDYFENKPIIDPPELVKKMEAEVREANQDKAWRREVMNLEMKLYDHEKLGPLYYHQ